MLRRTALYPAHNRQITGYSLLLNRLSYLSRSHGPAKRPGDSLDCFDLSYILFSKFLIVLVINLSHLLASFFKSCDPKQAHKYSPRVLIGISANSKGLIHASYVQWLLATVPVDLHLVCATFRLQKTCLRAVSCLGSTFPWINTILTYPTELHPICFRLVSPFTWGPSFSVRAAANHTKIILQRVTNCEDRKLVN